MLENGIRFFADAAFLGVFLSLVLAFGSFSAWRALCWAAAFAAVGLILNGIALHL